MAVHYIRLINSSFLFIHTDLNNPSEILGNFWDLSLKLVLIRTSYVAIQIIFLIKTIRWRRVMDSRTELLRGLNTRKPAKRLGLHSKRHIRRFLCLRTDWKQGCFRHSISEDLSTKSQLTVKEKRQKKSWSSCFTRDRTR